MRKRKQESASDERSATERPRMSPTDIQQKEFRLAFRGYNERDVDEFLDQLTEELAGHIEENRRLRGQASLGGTSARTDDASREAEAILAKARAEAGRVVREAEERAAMVGARGIDTRAVVAPYLSRERDFLQSLGQLVQGHAETIRGMVQTHRERTEPSVPPARSTSPEPVRVEGTEESSVTSTSREAVVVATEPSEAATSEATTSAPESEPGAAAEPAGSERQRSLRELFWGED